MISVVASGQLSCRTNEILKSDTFSDPCRHPSASCLLLTCAHSSSVGSIEEHCRDAGVGQRDSGADCGAVCPLGKANLTGCLNQQIVFSYKLLAKSPLVFMLGPKGSPRAESDLSKDMSKNCSLSGMSFVAVKPSPLGLGFEQNWPNANTL